MITKEQIDRINAYARRVKAGEELTPEELAERDALRQAYVASVRENLVSQLESIRVVEPDGTKHRLPRKDPGGV